MVEIQLLYLLWLLPKHASTSPYDTVHFLLRKFSPLHRVGGAKCVHLLALTSCELDPGALISSPYSKITFKTSSTEPSYSHRILNLLTIALANPCYIRAKLHPPNQPLTPSRHSRRDIERTGSISTFFRVYTIE